MAYHFHWPREELLTMTHKERHQWVKEVSEINEKIKKGKVVVLTAEEAVKLVKEKGIKKRKRSKLVYDEQTDEWKRRHGYDRVKDADRIIIADAKMSDVPGKTEDPFTREERERRERVEKNQGKQLKNLQNAVATHGKHVLPPTLQMSAAPKKGVKALPLNGMKKQQIRDLTAQVAKSTASMAKYNAPIPGDEKIKTRGRRRQFDSVTDTGTERERAQGFIDKLVRREKDFTVDVNVAARRIQRRKSSFSIVVGSCRDQIWWICIHKRITSTRREINLVKILGTKNV